MNRYDYSKLEYRVRGAISKIAYDVIDSDESQRRLEPWVRNTFIAFVHRMKEDERVFTPKVEREAFSSGTIEKMRDRPYITDDEIDAVIYYIEAMWTKISNQDSLLYRDLKNFRSKEITRKVFQELGT